MTQTVEIIVTPRAEGQQLDTIHDMYVDATASTSQLPVLTPRQQSSELGETSG